MGRFIGDTVPEYAFAIVDLVDPSDPIQVAPSYLVDSHWTL